MKAVTIHEFGGPEVLQVEDVEKPTPKENEVLVEVHASSLNPVDEKSISPDSYYRSSMHLPVTPGMDIAGIVEVVGSKVKNIRVGDHVFGQASVLQKGSGAFAEFAVTPGDSIALMPSNLSFVEAAAAPLAACSAYEAIVERMALKANQKVLIHGGSGGIGSFAIQLAKYMGAYVTATAADEGVTFAKKIGADSVVNYKTDLFEESGREYHAVLDTVGGETYDKSFEVLKKDGILVSMLVKPNEELMEKFGVRAELLMTKVNSKVLGEIANLIAQGFLKVHIDRVYPLERTKEAYQAKEHAKILGKIAIDVKHHS